MDNKVFFSISQIKVKTAQHLLRVAGIESHSINKIDSAHPGVFGHIELYVPKDDEEAARKILQEAEIL